jgi:hypothetical protein
LNIRYKFGSKNLMSVIMHLLAVSKHSCNDKAVTGENLTVFVWHFDWDALRNKILMLRYQLMIYSVQAVKQTVP